MIDQTSVLAITMGDASGIGPEIIVKSIAIDGQNTLVFGSCVVMEDAARRLDCNLRIQRIDSIDEANFKPNILQVFETTKIIKPPPIGCVNSISGQASFDTLVAAITAAKAGRISELSRRQSIRRL